MALITCTHCGKQMSDRADVCPHCGKIAEKKLIVYKEQKDLLLSIISCICFIISYCFAYSSWRGDLFSIIRYFHSWNMFSIVPLVLGIVFHCKNKSKKNISGIGFGLYLLLIAYPTIYGLLRPDRLSVNWTLVILEYILCLLIAAVAHYLICKHKSVKFKLIAGIVILIFILICRYLFLLFY